MDVVLIKQNYSQGIWNIWMRRVICIMKPSKSWAIKRLGIPRNIHPGLYAIDVQADWLWKWIIKNIRNVLIGCIL